MSIKKSLCAIASLLLVVSASAAPAKGENFDCMSFKVAEKRDASWSTFPGKEMRYVITWNVYDPNKCIISTVRNLYPDSVMWVGLSSSQRGYWPGTWNLTRSGENAIISLDFEVPLSWLNAIGNQPGNYDYGMPKDAYAGWSHLVAYGLFDIRADNFFKKETKSVDAMITGAEIWSTWFAKQQNLKTDECDPVAASREFETI